MIIVGVVSVLVSAVLFLVIYRLSVLTRWFQQFESSMHCRNEHICIHGDSVSLCALFWDGKVTLSKVK